MKHLYIIIVALFMLPTFTFAQSDDDKSDELKELKAEIQALKKDMKSDSDEASEKEQEEEMEALKQELKSLKKEQKADKKKDKVEVDEALEFNYSIPEQQVYTDEKAMSLGVEPCFVLLIPDMKEKDVKNRWKDYMGQYDTKPKKVKGSKHEQKCAGATIYDLGYGKYDVHSTVYQSGGVNEVAVWFYNGERFVAESDENGDRVSKFMQKFGVFVEKSKVDKEMESEEKMLKKHTDRQDKLVKEKKKLEDNIAKWEREIEDAKGKIERNKTDQQNNLIEVENQQKVVKMVQGKLSKF